MPSRPTLPALPHAAAARRLYQLRRPLSTGWQARSHPVRRNDRLSACYGNPRLRRSGSRGVRVRVRHRISRSGSSRRFQTSHVATGTRRPALGPTGAARPATRSGSVLTESGCAERGGAGSGGHSVPSPCRRAPIATSGCYDSPGSMWLNRTACRREARSTTGWTSIASTRWRASSPTRAAGGGWSAGASEGWPARWRSRRRRSPTAARAGGTIAPSTASVAARPESRATPPPAGRRRWPPNRGSHATA